MGTATRPGTDAGARTVLGTVTRAGFGSDTDVGSGPEACATEGALSRPVARMELGMVMATGVGTGPETGTATGIMKGGGMDCFVYNFGIGYYGYGQGTGHGNRCGGGYGSGNADIGEIGDGYGNWYGCGYGYGRGHGSGLGYDDRTDGR